MNEEFMLTKVNYMNLKHITALTCPKCDCRVQEDRQQGQPHANGQFFETREFVCGLIHEWSPNYSRLVERGECHRSNEHKLACEQRNACIQHLLEEIDKQDVDAKFKANFKRYVGDFCFTGMIS